MAQSAQVINQGTGAEFRSQLNTILAALFSSSSGPTEPATHRAGQLWFDNSVPSHDRLWIRNAIDTDWIQMTLGNIAAPVLSYTMKDGTQLRGRVIAASGASAAQLSLEAYDNAGVLQASVVLNENAFGSRMAFSMTNAGLIRDRMRATQGSNILRFETLDAAAVVQGLVNVAPAGLIASRGGIGVLDTSGFIRSMLTADRTAVVASTWDVRDNAGAVQRIAKLNEVDGLSIQDGAGANNKVLLNAGNFATTADVTAGTAGKLIDAADPLPYKWQSAPITVTLAAGGLVTHTLPRAPRSMTAFMIFTAAVTPYVIGDLIRTMVDHTSTASGFGIAISIPAGSTTQIRYLCGATAPALVPSSSGGNVNPTPAQAQLVIMAEC